MMPSNKEKPKEATTTTTSMTRVPSSNAVPCMVTLQKIISYYEYSEESHVFRNNSISKISKDETHEIPMMSDIITVEIGDVSIVPVQIRERGLTITVTAGILVSLDFGFLVSLTSRLLVSLTT